MTSQAMNSIISDAQAALKSRLYFTAYPENPKVYPEDWNELGKTAFSKQLNENFQGLDYILELHLLLLNRFPLPHPFHSFKCSQTKQE